MPSSMSVPAYATCVSGAGVGAPEQHYVVPSGFDLSRSRAAVQPENWRDLLRLEPHERRPPVVVMLAAFEPRKRHLEFLERLPRIAARIPEVRLVIAGDGKLRTAIDASNGSGSGETSSSPASTSILSS